MKLSETPLLIPPVPEDNITDLLEQRVAATPDQALFATPSNGGWSDISAAEFRRQVISLAKGLTASGIEPGDRVAFMCKTSYEWSLVDFAILYTGAVMVPVYETSSALQIHWILEDSGAKHFIIETGDQHARFAEVEDQLTNVKQVWRLDEGAVAKLGEQGVGVEDAEIERRRNIAVGSDMATLIYTSGSTGRPRGCVITHSNFVDLSRNAGGALSSLVQEEGASTLLFVTLAHVFARFISILCVHGGVRVGHQADTSQLLPALSTFHPTFLLAVPRVFEKVFTKAQQKAESEGKGKIFNLAADTAIEYSQALGKGSVPFTLKLKHGLFKKLVYSKLMDRLGNEAKYAVSGGSALGARLGHFFRGAGLTIVEGYGLTETTAPTSVNSPGFNKIGTVGQPMPGTTIRIADDGEILLKGDHIMVGYWQNEKATAEAFEDGFYRTGDLGSLDDDGFLSITGRKKEIIVTAGGKNVAPAVLEDRIRAHALVTIDPESFQLWKEQKNKSGEISDLTEDAELNAAIQEAVDDANKAVSKAEGIKKFKILPHDFTEEGGQMTASLKVKRHVVSKQWSKEIDDIYAG